MSSGPLSERMKSGASPRVSSNCSRTSTVLSVVIERATSTRLDLAGELVDDVQVPQPSAGCGLVILVVDRPDVVFMLGSAAAWDQCQRSRSGSSWLLCGSLLGLPLIKILCTRLRLTMKPFLLAIAQARR